MSRTRSLALVALAAGCIPERVQSSEFQRSHGAAHEYEWVRNEPQPPREQTYEEQAREAEDLMSALVDEFNAMWTALDNRMARASQRIRSSIDEINVEQGAAEDISNLVQRFRFEKERSVSNFEGAVAAINRGHEASFEEYLEEATASAGRARETVERLEQYADEAEQLANEPIEPQQRPVFTF